MLVQIWVRLGVRLVCSTFDYNPGEIRFSIQHPDLSSALAPPEEALAADFKEVQCAINIQCVGDGEDGGKTPKKRKVKKEKSKPGSDHPRVGDQERALVERELYDSLNPEDRRMIDDFLEGFDFAQLGNRRRKRPRGSFPVGHIEDARALIEGAVEIALLGGSKRVNGIKALEGADIQGLTQLLPGVFHMPHLKVSLVCIAYLCCN